ncbi:MAG: Asp-tRNA(Asn)/Glu-tRNA(Gln) amidotransferase subunit GatA [Clostridia bacterium]|nr:Asp-tRNA(Asn)/Glu-tRNA(Gln) amidotransferase subunit GatA [Clostridia bacterium]
MSSLKELRIKLDKKEIGAAELSKQYLDRIEAVDGKLNSYITVCRENAIEQAKAAQEIIDRGRAGMLTGIPISVKDNICTRGIRTTCASKMLADFVPPYDATAIERLKNAGAVILGKTNMDEFAMGGSSQSSYFGGVKNPYDITRVPGGSSGGAAASVAADLCAAALGSDTGGSVRQPAAFCGVTGIKPTYGTVSRWGLVAFASSLEQIGVIAKSAEDCGYILNCIYGYDKNDATSSKTAAREYTALVGNDISKMKIGLPREFFGNGINDEVKAAVLNAAEYYKKLGCEIVNVSLPSLEYAVSAYYLISSAEASSNLSRYDGIRFGYRSENGTDFDELIKNTRGEAFGREVKRRILLGNYALSQGYYDEYYKKATQIRTRIISEYAEIFKQCDIILTPTAPTTAYKTGGQENDPVKMYLADICTVTANIAGLPSITTTCGYDKNGLPIGMSVTGHAFDEQTIIAVCDRFERDFDRREARI